MPLQNNVDLIVGFERDQSNDEEFFMTISSKAKNPKTGEIDSISIPVNDIDEIEHTHGTLKFYIHYQASANGVNQQGIQGQFNKSFGTFLKKKMKLQQNDESTQGAKLEKSVLFESKYVKQIIETFNNVLELVD